MAIEGLKRIWGIPSIKRESDGKFPPKNKKEQKKPDKDEKNEKSKIDIKV